MWKWTQTTPNHHRRIHGTQHFLHSCLFFLKRRTFNVYKANHQRGFGWIDWVIYRNFRFYFDPIWFFIQLEQKMRSAVRFVVFNSIRYWIGPISYLANVIAGLQCLHICAHCASDASKVHKLCTQPKMNQLLWYFSVIFTWQLHFNLHKNQNF